MRPMAVLTARHEQSTGQRHPSVVAFDFVGRVTRQRAGEWACLRTRPVPTRQRILAGGQLPRCGPCCLGVLMVLAEPVLATPEYVLPTLFDVTGVATNDVLNIRATPDAGAPILDSLAPDARGIEVVGYDDSGRWGRINHAEQSGWVALRYLAYRTDVWEAGALPATLRCFGTEPFWSLQADGDGVIFETPERTSPLVPLDQILDTGAFRDPRRVFRAEVSVGTLTAVMVPMACSDGMSDRAYGLDVTVVLSGGGGARMLTGCCSIAP